MLVFSDATGELLLKLTDFSSSYHLAHPDEYVTSRAGSLQYQAPEVLGEQKICLASDMFSYGVLLFSILALTFPFTGKNAEDRKTKIPPIPPCNEHYKETIQGCWQLDPINRPKAASCVDVFATLFQAKKIEKIKSTSGQENEPPQQKKARHGV